MMPMSVQQHNEQLTLEKAQVSQIAESRLGVIGVLTILFGQEKNGALELRLTKAQLEKIEGNHVSLRGLKRGGLVVEVRPIEERT